MNNKFIHFACWNNLNDIDNTCLRPVMKELNAVILENPVDFISIAGDNYYPYKYKQNGKKIKYIYPSLLNNGFKLLPTNIPIYMILGNHDLETNLEKTNLFINNIETPEDSCDIIKFQEQNVMQNSDIEYMLFKEIFLSDTGTLILMIDTSMYSADAIKFMPCYNYFLKTNYSLEELQNFQNMFIQSTISNNKKNINNLIIIGHHPIAGIKSKDGFIESLNEIPYFMPMLREIYHLIGSKVKYYYLCGDLHLYQKGNISILVNDDQTMDIDQYIVGTGGTKLDDKIPDTYIDYSYNNENLTYIMKECKHKCGFLKCSINPIPTFDFHTIELITRGGTYKKKKYKKKYKLKRKTQKKREK